MIRYRTRESSERDDLSGSAGIMRHAKAAAKERCVSVIKSVCSMSESKVEIENIAIRDKANAENTAVILRFNGVLTTSLSSSTLTSMLLAKTSSVNGSRRIA